MATKNTGKFVLAGLLGAVAGAVGGLLFAPQSGKETRKDIADFTKKVKKQIVTSAEETEERVKEVFGDVSEAAVEKYNEVKGVVVDKLVALKSAGNEIDKEKYGQIVDSVIDEFRDDFAATKSGAIKMSSQMKKDWEKIKKVLA